MEEAALDSTRLAASADRSLHQADARALPRRGPAPCPPYPHCHEKYRLIMGLGGGASFRCQDELLEVQSGDVLTVAPGWVHQILPHGNPPQLLSVEFVPGTFLDPGEFAALHGVFATPVAHCQGPGAEHIEQLLRRLRREQQLEQDGSLYALRGYALALLVELQRRKAADEDGARRVLDAEREMRAVRALIEQRLAERVRLQELAAVAHTSVRQLTTLFKRAYGMTPLQYQTKLRITAAQELLLHSDLGVQAVARAVGYGNLSHFYRLFEQSTGTSPGRFRSGIDGRH